MAKWNRKRPDRDGWWEWREGGRGQPERVLLTGDGRVVADDDLWSRVMGREPSEVMCENYWEGTDTTKKYMPGDWRYVGPAVEV